MPQPFVFLVAVFSFYSFAQEIPATNFKVNPKFQFKINEMQSKSQGSAGFNLVFENSEFEVHARGTRIADGKAGKQMSEVELANIKKIFEARRNPYEGQITDVIQCDKNLKPQSFSFNLGGRNIEGVLAGANARKTLGACADDQLSYWASYFNFYDSQSLFVLEFRIFSKITAATPAKIKTLSDKLKVASKDLLQVRSAP